VARRESDRTARSVLDSLSSNIAVLDENGTILAVNRAWIEFAEQNQETGFCSEGTNYLSVCEMTVGESDTARFAKGIRDVLAGRQDSFSLEYSCHSSHQKRWFLGRVSPFLGDGPRRAVVVHLDVTEQKLADEALRNYADRLENLRAIDLAILSAHSTAEIAGATLKHLSRLMPCSLGEVALYDLDRKSTLTIASLGILERWHPPGMRFIHSFDGYTELDALRQGDIVVDDDIEEGDLTSPLRQELRGEGLRSSILIPLMFRGRLAGSIFLGSEMPGAYRAEHIEIAREVADHLAIAIRQSLLLEDLRLAKARMESLSRQLLRAQEDERRRIARELHDEVGQSLTAAKIAVDRIALMPAFETVHSRLTDVSSLIGGTLDQVRDLSRLLRPSILDDLGLEEALLALAEGMTERTGLAIDVDSDGVIGSIDPELESVCYRIAQEALNNAVKHAQATRLRVRLRRSEGVLELLIVDDGVGFDLEEATARASQGASLGLLSLSERATLAGGSTRIQSRPGEGTQVCASFPDPHRASSQNNQEEN
jgi:PAS domain S-box-containing protein